MKKAQIHSIWKDKRRKIPQNQKKSKIIKAILFRLGQINWELDKMDNFPEKYVTKTPPEETENLSWQVTTEKNKVVKGLPI